MTDCAKLTNEELEAELTNRWMVITEYTRQYRELAAERDRRERHSARKWISTHFGQFAELTPLKE
jgi:hypothetical protein